VVLNFASSSLPIKVLDHLYYVSHLKLFALFGYTLPLRLNASEKCEPFGRILQNIFFNLIKVYFFHRLLLRSISKFFLLIHSRTAINFKTKFEINNV
jgi:hypothetical protein